MALPKKLKQSDNKYYVDSIKNWHILQKNENSQLIVKAEVKHSKYLTWKYMTFSTDLLCEDKYLEVQFKNMFLKALFLSWNHLGAVWPNLEIF